MLISKVSTSISDVFKVHVFASAEESKSRSCTNLDIRIHSESIISVCCLFSVDRVSSLPIHSAEDRITAKGDFSSCDADAINSFWLCKALSVGFVAVLINNLARNSISTKTINHVVI